MLILRPVKEKDLDQLYELASLTHFGLTTLPKDKAILRQRIRSSIKTFSHVSGKPGGELYFFVLEDTQKKTSGRDLCHHVQSGWF